MTTGYRIGPAFNYQKDLTIPFCTSKCTVPVGECDGDGGHPDCQFFVVRHRRQRRIDPPTGPASYKLLDRGRVTAVITIVLESQYGAHIWKHVVAKGWHTCAICGLSITSSGNCYRPQTFARRIMADRICVPCVERMIEMEVAG